MNARLVLSTLAVSGLLLTTAACTEDGKSVVTGPTPPKPPASAPPATSAAAKDALLAALAKTEGATFKFGVQGDLPEGDKVKGSGTYDKAAKRITLTTTISGPDKQNGQRIVIGDDAYQRTRSGGQWVHLDQKRVKKDVPEYFDMTDPTGLERFTKSIGGVSEDGPGKYKGDFNAAQEALKPFLPIGAPSVVTVGGSVQTTGFTATTDAAGYVTSIAVSMKPSSESPTLKMSTTFSAHGKPASIKKPSHAAEADPIYYK